MTLALTQSPGTAQVEFMWHDKLLEPTVSVLHYSGSWQWSKVVEVTGSPAGHFVVFITAANSVTLANSEMDRKWPDLVKTFRAPLTQAADLLLLHSDTRRIIKLWLIRVLTQEGWRVWIHPIYGDRGESATGSFTTYMTYMTFRERTRQMVEIHLQFPVPLTLAEILENLQVDNPEHWEWLLP